MLRNHEVHCNHLNQLCNTQKPKKVRHALRRKSNLLLSESFWTSVCEYCSECWITVLPQMHPQSQKKKKIVKITTVATFTICYFLELTLSDAIAWVLCLFFFIQTCVVQQNLCLFPCIWIGIALFAVMLLTLHHSWVACLVSSKHLPFKLLCLVVGL